MKVYKILHKGTGLYFTPSRGNGNLSAKGKIYEMTPRLEWTKTIRVMLKTWSGADLSKRQKSLIDYFKLTSEGGKNSYWIDENFDTKPSDWEIIEL